MPISSPIPETDSKPVSISLILLDRMWPYLLVAIACGALIPMVIRGAGEFIGYDGFWHVFIATQNRWKLFLFEYKNNAHPPLFMLLLRVMALFGHSRLILRFISMSAGLGSICLIGLIAKRFCRDGLVALLAVAAYAFSITMLEINLEVRSYPLCLFFVLAAFYFLVDFLARDLDARGRRSLVLWGSLSSLAIGTEYYAIFFVMACVACVALFVPMRRELRQAASRWSAANRVQVLFALLLPLATMTYFYRTHIRHQPLNYGHVIEFYWTPGTSKLAFVLRNLRADLNFVLPLEITSTAGLLLFLAICVLLIGLVLFLRRRRGGIAMAALPACMTFVLLAELIAASLLRRYPFGGFDRQQSILFPFLFLTGFVLLDLAISFLPALSLRAAVAAIVVFLIGAHFLYGWRRLAHIPTELFTNEYATYRVKVVSAPAIFLDQFTLIGYYMQTNEWKWKFRRHLHEPNRVDEYELTTSSGRHIMLFRDLDTWNFDLHQPFMYQVLAHSLHDSNLTSANVFLVKQAKGHANAAGIVAEESEIRQRAAATGLRVDSLYDDNEQADISFALQ
jgi:Dolichyl-phosphate-mannose-protein mannosyltransferase